ncbi:MAG: hypothetical protein PHT76_11475 [Anaerostipes sp.]|nr:hypothetical protein [Anaerostipes sp.]
MDLIYANNIREEIGVLKNYNFDLAYGVDENDFVLTMDKDSHCLDEDNYIFYNDTEYGGIIDNIEVKESDSTVIYGGRTWHGILNGKIIEPDKGQDYLFVYGDLNTILADLIIRLDLSDVFKVEEEPCGIEVVAYQIPRYQPAYTTLITMFQSAMAKLKFNYKYGFVVLSAEPLVDYSVDDEFDNDMIDFTMKKNYNLVNHLICLGQGDLKDRKVIHLFTDEGGGVQPYTYTNAPLQDSDYILDVSRQVVFGANEIVEVYDVSNAEITKNYILLDNVPNDWGYNYENYYYFKEPENEDDAGKFESVTGVNSDKYSLISEKPPDWETEYGSYYIYSNNTPNSVSSVDSIKEVKIVKKPSDWNENYGNYYTKSWDGVQWIKNNINGVSWTKYTRQTKQPSDWNKNYGDYYNYVYHKKTKTKKAYYSHEKVTKEGKKGHLKTPKWNKRKRYTAYPRTSVPKFKTCYKETSTQVAPTFTTGKYYKKTEITNAPPFGKKMYYRQVEDNFAELVSAALDKLKEYYEKDTIELDLDESKTYDISDIVGASDYITGIKVAKHISKKIVTFENGIETISYEVEGDNQ